MFSNMQKWSHLQFTGADSSLILVEYGGRATQATVDHLGMKNK